jgi:hypothetical protein
MENFEIEKLLQTKRKSRKCTERRKDRRKDVDGIGIYNTREE